MGNEIELVTDGDGLSVIGAPTDVERFLLDQGLDRAPSRALDARRLTALLGTGGTAAQVGSEFAANSGRWVKLTAESAAAVKDYGLMATKTPGVSHAMIGRPGEIQRWIQVSRAPGALLAGPLVLPALATMMQQQAMQQQMDEIVEYLQQINAKVDDILRSQKDAVLADMIGVDLIIEEALTVRKQVGRVSEVTWSKVQSTSMTIARTQAYALRQLDAIADKLEKTSGLGEIAKATKDAELNVREWLSVLARTFQLQDGVSVLELDRVLDVSPDELDSHRVGLAIARRNRLDLIARNTARLLTQMDDIVRKANSKVLFNPFDSPAAVRSSNQVTIGVITFRERLGIDSGQESTDAKLWKQAAGEVLERVRATSAEGAAAAKRFGDKKLERATGAFRSVDVDGDGVPDQPRAAAAAEQAGTVIKGAATGLAGAFGTLFQRKADSTNTAHEHEAERSATSTDER